MEALDYNFIAELVDKAKAGDSDSFAELYVATYEKEYNFAKNYLRDEYLAQDAIQDAYIIALRNLEKLRNSTLFISWLNQIVFRVCFRTKEKQNKYLFKEIDEKLLHSLSLHGEKRNPEEEALKQDQNDSVRSALRSIPFSQAHILIMHYYDGMKIDEIASITGQSRSTVKRRLASGKEALRQALNGKEEG